jgi:hypothetical protein
MWFFASPDARSTAGHPPARSRSGQRADCLFFGSEKTGFPIPNPFGMMVLMGLAVLASSFRWCGERVTGEGS